MFTIEQIKAAHSKVKSGADFPNYVQDLIKLGVVRYNSFVTDGHIEYEGDNNYHIQSNPNYEALPVSQISDIPAFQHYLKLHQQGQTNYPTFCGHAAETGVEKWTVDMSKMTCTYYDREGNEMLREEIPGS